MLLRYAILFFLKPLGTYAGTVLLNRSADQTKVSRHVAIVARRITLQLPLAKLLTRRYTHLHVADFGGLWCEQV